jgi:L-asparaginase II
VTRAGRTLASVTRYDVHGGRQVEESRHVGHLVVVDGAGTHLAVLGRPDLPTFVRSAAKPFQATACLEVLGVDGAASGASSPSPPEVAVGWGSHRAEPAHLEAVGRLLARSATPPEALTCPAAPGIDDPTAGVSRIRHNCSGKHALFALAGLRQGTDRGELLTPDGPLQRVVLGVVAEVLGPPVAVGVDGCGAPAVAVPLDRLAGAYAAFATDARFARVRRAGLAHPDLVGGKGRLETALLDAGIVAKVGAEGVFAAGWTASDGSPRGLAVKAADGAERAATVATAAVLDRLGLLPYGAWRPAPVTGGAREVGEVIASVEVGELADRLVAG